MNECVTSKLVSCTDDKVSTCNEVVVTNKVSSASDFRKILHKNALSEQAVCTKYGVDCIEELTGSDVLDVLTGIVLSNQDQKQ